MSVSFILLAGLTLALPGGERVRTDCFRGMGGVVPSRNAWAEVTRTDEALVVWVGRRLSKGELPRARGSGERPESMFADGGECVELALAPCKDDPSLYYHFIANPSNSLYEARRRDGSWRPYRPVSTRVVIEDGRWGVEFVVPYAALDVSPPEDGDRWRASFAVLTDSWAGVRDFHDTRQFGTLVFGPGQDRATVETVETDGSGFLRVTYVVPPRRLKGSMPHKPDGASFSLALSDGGRKLGAFDVHLADATAADVTLDRYYYPAMTRLAIAYRASSFRKATVGIRCLSTGEMIARCERAVVPGVFDCRPLPVGEYVLEISDGQAFAACQFEVCAGDAAPGGRRHWYPIVGSERLPSEGVSFKKAVPNRFTRSCGVGYVYDSDLPLYGAKELLSGESGDKTLFRLAYEAQMAVLLRSGRGKLPQRVPDGSKFYLDTYRELKRVFPHLRFSIHVDSPKRASEYAKACDVFEYAHPGCSYARDLLENLREAVAFMQSCAAGRPTMLWLGAAFPDNGKWRTAEELNTAVRYCVLKGVSGNVLHLGHGGIPRSNTRMWSYMEQCERAVNRWYSDWVEGKKISPEIHADPGIEHGTRVNGDRTVTIAVNLDKREQVMRLRLCRQGKERLIRLPGCGSVVLVEDGLQE